MKILGIHNGHDAGAALIEDGRVLAAVNEERMNRKKMYWGDPVLAIEEVLRISKVNPKDIDFVAVSGITKGGGISPEFDRVKPIKKLADYLSFIPFFRGHLIKNIYCFIFSRLRNEKSLTVIIREKINSSAPLEFIEHHESHAAGAYYFSQFGDKPEEDILIVTVDSAGDGLCATISVVENGLVKRKNETVFFHSPGAIYSYVTHNLGFKYGRHEGKITGLAAYGDSAKTVGIFRNILSVDKEKLEFRSRLGCWGRPGARRLHLLMQAKKREDIAAGVQKIIEEVTADLVEAAANRYNKKFVCLAGGLFANVKLNQRILEIPKVKDIYIHQNMGDGGQALGAAVSLYAKNKNGIKPLALSHVYLGSDYGDSAIVEALQASSLVFKKADDIHRQVAELLAAGKIVARFAGAMEYGPRALGHRSILYQTSDKTVNDWLNKKLKRTEFMPFAPIILRERANEYFENFDQDCSHAADFMTVTYNVSKQCDADSPAITHIDKTARPQTVDAENNHDSYRILEEYERLTGKPILINTSFNMHEEPIVRTPSEAIEAFRASGLDVLAIGDYLVLAAENKIK